VAFWPFLFISGWNPVGPNALTAIMLTLWTGINRDIPVKGQDEPPDGHFQRKICNVSRQIRSAQIAPGLV
jgi:hypothetical protein